MDEDTSKEFLMEIDINDYNSDMINIQYNSFLPFTTTPSSVKGAGTKQAPASTTAPTAAAAGKA